MKNYLLISAFSLLVSVSVAAGAIKPTEIILDDYNRVKVGHPGFSFRGKWSPSTGGMDYEGESHWAPNSETNENIAYFRPMLKVAGIYKVFIIYPDDPNDDHATDMPVTVHYGKNGKQSNSTAVNLKESTGEWVSLGVYSFTKGKKGYVELGSKADGNLVADACKFVLDESTRRNERRLRHTVT